MNELEKLDPNGKKNIGQDEITEADVETTNELPPIAQPSLRERVRKLLTNPQRDGAEPRQDLTKDRTRSLLLLIGGTVGAVLLFLGVFSKPPAPPPQQTSSRGAPNLGRGSAATPPAASRSSVTPLLNADVSENEDHSDQVSPADIQGTARRTSGSDSSHSPQLRSDVRISQSTPRLQQNVDGTSSSNAVSDPLAAYRLNNGTGPPTYSYGGPSAAAAGCGEVSRTSASGITLATVENRPDTSSSTKSSIVFMRSSELEATVGETGPDVTAPIEPISLLPPGTRLVARLESAATTALKTPVVASIEYHYERDGIIVVPAGTKVFGDVQQASSEGYLNIRFHTLRMPDGREETIEGAGVSLDQKPLKGQVSGKNTVKKLLSQALSGVGTVAAYVIGAGGAGLSRSITGETLLRDRFASNIALAGEQELANAAYSQNISVTVPANTRLYVVLQRAAVNTTIPAPSRTSRTAAPPVEIPSVQELRELMELRREINRMYQESNIPPSGVARP